mmetsp:Transcript_93754/g.286879  ORF Transcript_93754/g.286879 Transcript_93754/m.286879 type:complete len:228 (-) Transcript_93754:932-1615(-)
MVGPKLCFLNHSSLLSVGALRQTLRKKNDASVRRINRSWAQYFRARSLVCAWLACSNEPPRRLPRRGVGCALLWAPDVHAADAALDASQDLGETRASLVRELGRGDPAGPEKNGFVADSHLAAWPCRVPQVHHGHVHASGAGNRVKPPIDPDIGLVARRAREAVRVTRADRGDEAPPRRSPSTAVTHGSALLDHFNVGDFGRKSHDLQQLAFHNGDDVEVLQPRPPE